MTETHNGHHEEHHNPPYFLIFAILCVLTVISFLTVQDFWIKNMGERSGPILVMIVGVCKATLVAMFFMHLKYDWFKLYFMIVPTLIMGTILMCALLPDMTFSQTRLIHGQPPPAFGK